MGQPIVQQFTTTADQTGIKQMSVGLKGLKQDMAGIEVESKKVSSVTDQSLKKLSAPIARTAFRGMAMQAAGVASSLGTIQSKAEAASAGVQILASSLISFGGTLGIAAVGILGIITLLNKFGPGAKKSAQAVKEQADALLTDASNAEQAAKSLSKLGIINDTEAKRLREVSGLKTKELADLRKRTIDEQYLLNLKIKTLEQNKKEEKDLANRDQISNRIVYNRQRLAEVEKTLILLGVNASEQDRKRGEALSKRAEYAAEIASLEASRMVQGLEASGKYNELLRLQAALKMDLVAAEAQLIQALKTGDEATIESAKTRVEAIRNEAAEVSNAVSRINSSMQVQLSAMQNASDSIVGIWDYQNDRLQISTEKTGILLIQTTASTIQKIIAMEAALALAQGNFIKHAALIAAGVAVGAIAGVASKVLEHESQRDRSPANGRGGSMSSPSEGDVKETYLTVKIEGGYFDASAAQNLAKYLSKAVQERGVRLVASTVQPAYGVGT